MLTRFVFSVFTRVKLSNGMTHSPAPYGPIKLEGPQTIEYRASYWEDSYGRLVNKRGRSEFSSEKNMFFFVRWLEENHHHFDATPSVFDDLLNLYVVDGSITGGYHSSNQHRDPKNCTFQIPISNFVVFQPPTHGMVASWTSLSDFLISIITPIIFQASTAMFDAPTWTRRTIFLYGGRLWVKSLVPLGP